jgi:hypothetical protein
MRRHPHFAPAIIYAFQKSTAQDSAHALGKFWALTDSDDESDVEDLGIADELATNIVSSQSRCTLGGPWERGKYSCGCKCWNGRGENYNDQCLSNSTAKITGKQEEEEDCLASTGNQVTMDETMARSSAEEVSHSRHHG